MTKDEKTKDEGQQCVAFVLRLSSFVYTLSLIARAERIHTGMRVAYSAQQLMEPTER